MYANFAHFFIPKLCGCLSFIINPITVYIVRTDEKLQLGNYRYLLFYFAVFNVLCSITDILAPVCVLNYRYAFSVFITDGFFQSYSEFHQFILAIRCGFISGTYAVLHSHYLYRFFVIFNDKILILYFLPYGILLITVYTLFHMSFWTVTCYFFIGADIPRRQYMQKAIYKEHGLGSMNLTVVIAQYNEGPYESIRDTWIAIISMTILSIFSLAFIFIIGYQIMKKLRNHNLSMSEKTKRLQTQLMKALIVQAAIPTCVSFSPCIFAWYQPVFGYDGGRWLQLTAGIAVSTFPCLDPLALVVFVPTFRRRFKEIFLFIVPKRYNRTSQQSGISSKAEREDQQGI